MSGSEAITANQRAGPQVEFPDETGLQIGAEPLPFPPDFFGQSLVCVPLCWIDVVIIRGREHLRHLRPMPFQCHQIPSRRTEPPDADDRADLAMKARSLEFLDGEPDIFSGIRRSGLKQGGGLGDALLEKHRRYRLCLADIGIVSFSTCDEYPVEQASSPQFDRPLRASRRTPSTAEYQTEIGPAQLGGDQEIAVRRAYERRRQERMARHFLNLSTGLPSLACHDPGVTGMRSDNQVDAQARNAS